MSESKPIWFRAKTYGWGWTPATWQGWLVVLGYVVAIEGSTLGLLLPHATKGRVIAAAAAGVVETAVLAIICYRRGEKPRWRWGPEK